MADNQLRSNGRYVKLPVSTAEYDSGDPVCLGRITGVATADKDSSNNVVIDRAGSYDLSVKGVNDSGNSAVAVGDAIYFVAGDTPVLSKKDSGVLFGFALETVGSGATATIEVLLAYGAAITDHLHTLADVSDVTASAAEVNKLDGAGAVVASGTQAAHVADAKVDYTTGDLDIEAEIIAAFNTTNGKINSILAALEAFGINASS